MADRRKQPRIQTRGMNTPFGQVTNISDTGLCLFRKGKMDLSLGQTLRLAIEHGPERVTLEAEVVRIDRLGLFRHEIGLAIGAGDLEALGGIRRLIASSQAECIGPACHLAA